MELQADEPDGWRTAWGDLFTSPAPAEWADVPRNIRHQIFDHLDEATAVKKKKKGAA